MTLAWSGMNKWDRTELENKPLENGRSRIGHWLFQNPPFIRIVGGF